MSTSLNAVFPSRAEADLVVERLVQELGVERSDIFLSPEGDENSSGVTANGGDAPAPLEDARQDGATHSGITVSVDVNDVERSSAIREALGI